MTAFKVAIAEVIMFAINCYIEKSIASNSIIDIIFQKQKIAYK